MADTWKVLSQRETSDITTDGRFQQVMEVTVETITGTVVTISVPISQYNAETVGQLIEDRVAATIEVEQL